MPPGSPALMHPLKWPIHIGGNSPSHEVSSATQLLVTLGKPLSRACKMSGGVLVREITPRREDRAFLGRLPRRDRTARGRSGGKAGGT